MLKLGGTKIENLWLNLLLNPVERGDFGTMEEKEVVEEARKKWEEIVADEKIRDRARRLEFAELDYNTGMKHAKESGIKEERKDTIVKMQKNNFSIKEIADILNISEDEIKKILDEK